MFVCGFVMESFFLSTGAFFYFNDEIKGQFSRDSTDFKKEIYVTWKKWSLQIHGLSYNFFV